MTVSAKPIPEGFYNDTCAWLCETRLKRLIFTKKRSARRNLCACLAQTARSCMLN